MPDISVTGRRLLTTVSSRLARGRRSLPFEEVHVPLRARRREAVARWALVARTSARSAVAAAHLSLQRRAPDPVARGPAALLPAAEQGGRALRPRPVRAAQDHTRRDARAWWPWRRSSCCSWRAFRDCEFTGRSHPLLLWGALTGAARRVPGRGALRRRCAARNPSACWWSATPRAATLVRRKLAEDPRLNATVVGRVSVAARHVPAPRQAARARSTSCPRCSSEHRVERVIVAPTAGGRRRRGRRGQAGHRLRRPGGGAAPHARGDRHVGRVRRPRRPGAAGVRGFGLSPSSRLLKRAFDLRRTERC